MSKQEFRDSDTGVQASDGAPLCSAQQAAREVFTTNRLAEFVTRQELEKQTGHSATLWPLYVVKELLDNALDAAEEAAIAPEIAIEVTADRITVTDNGPGIAQKTIERLLDLSSRTSARAHYVSPTRGAQGQAISTILVMPHALAPGSGSGVIIESHGVAHRIAVHTNKLTGEPKLVRSISHGSVKNGTRVTVEWPQSASTILENAYGRFLPLGASYVVANPHLALSVRTPFDELAHGALDLDWTKWRACDPTSPHWYAPETFSKLVAAYAVKDQEGGKRRPLREFLELFDGLSATAKRSKILASVGLSRSYLDDLLHADGLNQTAVAALLLAMQAETKPVKPDRLGVIGEDNLRRRIGSTAFKYCRRVCVDVSGFPYVIEGAFACLNLGDDDESGRRMITAANFGTSPSLTFRFPNYGSSANEELAERYAGSDEPVFVFLHVVHPRLTFTDLGKTQVSLSGAAADDMQTVIEKITADWNKQRKAEERDHHARLRRQDALTKAQNRRMSIKESVYQHLPEAYERASGGYGARSRQIFYQLRPLVLADTGKETLDSQYIMQTLIPDFMGENSELCADWTVYYDDRGHLIEPHTGETIGLGTKSVRDYCGDWHGPICNGFSHRLR
jgi:DNA topoisomerase VI subunit B